MRVSLLNNTSPEQTAVAYSKASRSLRGIEDITKSLTPSQAGEFLKKWVVEEQHTSIAEHIPVSLFLEDVPLIVATWLEAYPGVAALARATRHVKVPRGYYLPPPHAHIAKKPEIFETYKVTAESLLDAYERTLPILMQHMAPTRAYEVARLLLPLGTLTNLAITTNAAVLLKVLTDGAAQPLRAVRDTCEEIRKVAAQVAPTLFSASGELGVSPRTTRLSSPSVAAGLNGSASLVPPTAGPHARSTSAVLFLGATPNSPEVDMSDHHRFFTFELFPDFPTLRDLLHLKKGVLTLCPYTTAYDVALPKEVHELGLVDEFSATLHKAGFAEERIAKVHAHAAQHLIPMAFRQRILYTLSKQDMIAIEAHVEPQNESQEFIQMWRTLYATASK